MNYAIFLIVILLANIVHGITGFAGTLLAMPVSLMLVGYEVAKPILNFLGLLSGFYVFFGNYKYINKKELIKIVIVMGAGILSAAFIKPFFVGSEAILYTILGCFVIWLGLNGLFFKIKFPQNNKIVPNITLVAAGIIHGLFVAGGALLVGYLANIIKDKREFRATISTVWIFLNTIILFDDIRMGYWSVDLMWQSLIAIPFLFLGMYFGTKLYYKLKVETFMKMTYILLVISGISLLI